MTLRVIAIRPTTPPDEGGGGVEPTPEPTSAPTYWWNPAYDRRLVVSAKNNSGLRLDEHLLQIPVPVGVTVDAGSLRVVEMTALDTVDRAYDWRYGTGSFPPNHSMTLFVSIAGSYLSVKVLGKWAAGETRYFGVYWDSTGGVAAESVTHLADMGAKGNYWGAGRVGPDTDLFNTTFWMGYPYGNPITGGFTAPAFGRSDSTLLRTMTYSVNGVGTQRLTGGTITNVETPPDKLLIEGALTFPTRSSGVDWTGVYTAEHRNIIYSGRKSNNTAPESLMKLVDALHITLTYTCARDYTPTAVSGSATAMGTTELLTLVSPASGFNGNNTELAEYRIPMFSAPLATGTVTQLAAASDLSSLAVLDTIIGAHNNLGGMALVMRAVSLSGFGAQSPQVKWAMPTSPASGTPTTVSLHLRNLSSSAVIPAGAAVALDFWLINGLTRNGTATGDNLLPDEMVGIVRALSVTPTVTVEPLESYADGVEETMTLASARAVAGFEWFVDNALARTNVAWNHVYQYNVRSGATVVQGGAAPVDDHDGAYGNAHALAGLCLRYRRTHDADLLPLIDASMQWLLNAEALAVSSYGSFWSGSVPYWLWTLDTPSVGLTAEGGIAGGGTTGTNVDPAFGVGYGTINYTRGQVRRSTSVDQLHIACIGLYHLLYMLRDEPAITGRQIYTDAKTYLARMVTFEAAHWTAATSRIAANLNALVLGNAAVANVTLSVPDSKDFFDWQEKSPNTDNFQADPSSNIATDGFFNMLLSLNKSAATIEAFMQGRSKDMLAADYGRHDVVSTVVATAGLPGDYPEGWPPRAAGGTFHRYTNGRTGDDHFLESRTGYRDAMNGRAPNRIEVVALAALIDPTYDIPVEMNGGEVVREVNVVDALDEMVMTAATYLLEPTTQAQRFAAAGTLGKTTSFDPQTVDLAFTGYALFAYELWWLVHNGAHIADYYPIEAGEEAPPDYLLDVSFANAPTGGVLAGAAGYVKLVDSNGILSRDAAGLLLDGTPTSLDGVIACDSGGTPIAYARAAGRTLVMPLLNRAAPASAFRRGWGAADLASATTEMGINTTATVLGMIENTTAPVTYVVGTGDVRAAFVMRAVGGMIVYKVGDAAPRLGWVTSSSSAAMYAKLHLTPNAALENTNDWAIFDDPTFGDDEDASCTLVTTPVTKNASLSGEANGIFHADFTLPAGSANLVAYKLIYRKQDASNYHAASVKRSSDNATWDLLVEKTVAGVTSTVKTVVNVGTPTRLIVELNGSTHIHATWTSASPTAAATVRGSNVTDATFASASDVAADWGAGTTVGTLRVWGFTHALYADLFPAPSREMVNVLAVGDSKITAVYNWFDQCMIALNASAGDAYHEAPQRFAASGTTAAYWASHIDSAIAGATAHASKGIIMLGANDCTATFNTTVQNAFVANYRALLDALHAWNPTLELWLGLPWRRSHAANCDLICDMLLPQIMSGRAYCHVGVDERVYIKASDDGVANTTDGIHPSAAGMAILAEQYAALLA